MEYGITVYASRDWHPKRHISFQEEGGKWPPHCIQDSKGALFHSDLMLPNETVIVTKGVRFDKDQNSAFDETGLGVYLNRKGIDRLFICGLALDVCVLATVMDAVNLGFDVGLILSGTRPVNDKDGSVAVEKMKKAGVKIIGQDNISGKEKRGLKPVNKIDEQEELPNPRLLQR
jgi:nicotinamidase/pyrazinamidase